MLNSIGNAFLMCTFASLWLCPLAGYSNVGGPLAKSGRKPPLSKTRTTAFPDVDDGAQDPSFKDQNAKINPEIVKQSNWTAPAAADKPQIFPSSPGDYGDVCCWEPHQSQVLNDIAQGHATKPFFGFVGVETCGDQNACSQKCTKEKCNYVTWFSTNNSAALYVVHKDKLTDLSPANFTKQEGTQSLVRRCLRQYDVTPSCTDLVSSYCPLCDEFMAFITKFNKTYKGCEFLRKFEIFKMNKLKIATLNEKRVTEDDATFTVTRFADSTHDEFVNSFTGARPDQGAPNIGEQITDPVLNVSGFQHLYLRFDWAEKGVIPKVRDQSDCGSCYAFTATDLVAAQYLIDRKEFGKSYTLAPQYILDCFKDPAAFGCDGGRPVRVLAALSKCAKNGDANSAVCEFPLETCLPYQNQASAICSKPTCPDAPKIRVEKYNMVDISNDYLEKQKMAALIERGPLVVQIDASDAWQFYEGGIIRAHQCTTKSNHAVLVTGYDFGVGVPAYIVRNTWSDDWGKVGFVYLEAGVNACGVGQTVTYACTANCEVSVDNFAKVSPGPLPPTSSTTTSAPTPAPQPPNYTQPSAAPPPPPPPPSYPGVATAPPAPIALPSVVPTATQYTVAPGLTFPTRGPYQNDADGKTPRSIDAIDATPKLPAIETSPTTAATWAEHPDIQRDSVDPVNRAGSRKRKSKGQGAHGGKREPRQRQQPRQQSQQ